MIAQSMYGARTTHNCKVQEASLLNPMLNKLRISLSRLKIRSTINTPDLIFTLENKIRPLKQAGLNSKPQKEINQNE
jgi:hypothetical protein